MGVGVGGSAVVRPVAPYSRIARGTGGEEGSNGHSQIGR